MILSSLWSVSDSTVVNAHAPSEHKHDEVKDSFYKVPQHPFVQFCRYRVKLLVLHCNANVGLCSQSRAAVGYGLVGRSLNYRKCGRTDTSVHFISHGCQRHFPWTKRPDGGSELWPSSNTKFRAVWTYIFIPPYIFLTGCLTKLRDNFSSHHVLCSIKP